VRLLLAWREYRLEPHLIGALLSGAPGLLLRQTRPVFGPAPAPIRSLPAGFGLVEGKDGVFGVLRGLLALDQSFRDVLAAGSALALARQGALRQMVSDDRLTVEHLTRACLRAALGAVAPGVQVPVTVEVMASPGRPLLFSRADGVVVGRLSVEWLALFALGLGAFRGRLVTSIWGRGDLAVVDTITVSGNGLLGDGQRCAVRARELVDAAPRPSIASCDE
jgi:hypothetical protein